MKLKNFSTVCKNAYFVKRQDFFQINFLKYFFYGLAMEPKPEPEP
jgi:hypothetical protein